MVIELTSGNLIFVDSADNTKIYHLNTTTNTLTQLDVDPSDSSGDNKSRDHKVQAFWHDRANKVIWGCDCDNDGTADDFDVWKLDYSVSELTPTVTEVDTSVGADINSVYALDIYIWSGDTYVRNIETRNAGANTYIITWDVDTAPFVEYMVYEIGIY